MDYESGIHEDDTPHPSSAKKEYKLTPEPADTEFRKEFPPDPTIGSELDEAARVWRVYRKEAESFDKALLQGWSETLDILLIFAGLFSAVATAFVVESYQFLQLDSSAYAAAALYILVAASNHSTGIKLPPPPDLAYGSSLSRWINGLWFTSILLSLAVALLSILAKQWITQYRARNSASARSPRDWARRREIYFQALNSWPVAEVVALLPVLLHLSLFLFFVGVIAFLWVLDQSIGIWVIVLGGFVGVFYTGCTLIPLWAPESPTSTPLVAQIRRAGLQTVISALKVLAAVLRFKATVRGRGRCLLWALPSSGRTRRAHLTLYVTTFLKGCKRRFTALAEHMRFAIQRFRRPSGWSLSNLRNTVGADPHPVIPRPSGVDSLTLSGRLQRSIERFSAMRGDESGIQFRLKQSCDDLDASAIYWLVVEVSDSDAVAVGLQALGALPWDSPIANALRAHDQLVNFASESAFTRSSSACSSSEALRVARSALCMCRDGKAVFLPTRIPSLVKLKDVDYPDLALVLLPVQKIQDIARNSATWKQGSPSLASTALLAVRARNRWASPVNLLCCDLRLFSPAEWDLALKAADPEFDTDSVPNFVKPFILAVIIDAMFPSRENDRSEYVNRNDWVDQLLGPVLNCVPAPDMSTPWTNNPLSPWDLIFLNSKRFLTAAVNHDALKHLLLYLDFVVYPAMRGATSESMSQFWKALTSIVHLLFTWSPCNDGWASSVGVALRICPRSTEIRTAVLDAILLTPRAAVGIHKSLWAMLGSATGHYPGTCWVEGADALAAYLGISLRGGQETAQTADWTDRFFAELPNDALVTHALQATAALEAALERSERIRATSGSTEAIGNNEERRRVEVLVHLFQHCAELRRNWFSELLAVTHDPYADENAVIPASILPYVETWSIRLARDRASLTKIQDEASRRGICQSCPEALGYVDHPGA